MLSSRLTVAICIIKSKKNSKIEDLSNLEKSYPKNWYSEIHYEEKSSKIQQIALQNRNNDLKKKDAKFSIQCTPKLTIDHFSSATNRSGKFSYYTYGSVVLLDTTYETSKYNLLLFSLMVKTNIVGIFILMSENPSSIKQALQIFKQ